jgi:hypothetical protein
MKIAAATFVLLACSDADRCKCCISSSLLITTPVALIVGKANLCSLRTSFEICVYQYICTSFYLMCCVVPVGSTEQRSLSSTSSQASPASVMQFDSYTTFDWDVYLRETSSVTAPPEYYKQVYHIPLEICTC